MKLELHDDEEGNTLAASVKNIDYAYQAEQWVQDLSTDEIKKDFNHLGDEKWHPIVKFVLFDDSGDQLAVWTRYKNGTVEITETSDCWTGEWQIGASPFIPKGN